MDNLKGMSTAEVKYMIKNCAWREVTTTWAEELEEWPKLCVLKELVEDLKLEVWVSPLQEEWKNCGQRGLCRSKG